MYIGKLLIAFLGYVLPMGQMSLWGSLNSFLSIKFTNLELLLIPITLKHKFQVSTPSINNKSSVFQFKKNLATRLNTQAGEDFNQLMEILIGFLDGDGYFDIGPQKQYSKNPNNQPKTTIRIRLGVNLQYKDKNLLELIVKRLGVGKIDYSKSKNQYRLIFFQEDILKVIYPYIQSNGIEFLVYNRRKQFFLYNYILENKIKHWEDIDLIQINNLFTESNKKLGFIDIINLNYFNNWLVGFTLAEGSFHIKARGTAHFSIVQSSIENYQIIKAIHYFIKGPDSFNYLIKPEKSKVYRISFSSKKDLNFIIKFYDNKLLGLKKLQFDNWKSYIFSKRTDSAPNVI
jgi:LAGLIDADG endonuclease